jgi:hypothetical protein
MTSATRSGVVVNVNGMFVPLAHPILGMDLFTDILFQRAFPITRRLGVISVGQV